MPATSLLPNRSFVVRIFSVHLLRLRIPVKTINTILDNADETVANLRKQLSGEAASVALAVALGRACAESGVDLQQVLAMAEIANREARAEQARVGSAA